MVGQDPDPEYDPTDDQQEIFGEPIPDVPPDDGDIDNSDE